MTKSERRRVLLGELSRLIERARAAGELEFAGALAIIGTELVLSRDAEVYAFLDPLLDSQKIAIAGLREAAKGRVN